MQKLLTAVVLWLAIGIAHAQTPPKPAFDAELAATVGADDYGMRRYVLVILKTGPTPVPAGKERDEMFKGHFSNINRLAAEGKLALAGPLDGVDGWRGLLPKQILRHAFYKSRENVTKDPDFFSL